ASPRSCLVPAPRPPPRPPLFPYTTLFRSPQHRLRLRPDLAHLVAGGSGLRRDRGRLDRAYLQLQARLPHPGRNRGRDRSRPYRTAEERQCLTPPSPPRRSPAIPTGSTTPAATTTRRTAPCWGSGCTS